MADNHIDIDPTEFFAFMAGYDDFPTNGYKLYEAAKVQQRSQELVTFFERLPGEFESEADILPHVESLAQNPQRPSDDHVKELRNEDIR